MCAAPQNDRPATGLYLSDGERSDILDVDGLPEVHLVEQVYGGEVILRFCDDVTGKLMTAEARRLKAVRIWAGKLRGMSHYASAARRADLRPGQPLALIRQPANPHDPQAAGVAAAGLTELVGYVNTAKARQLAKQLDQGIELAAVSLAGTGPEVDCGGITFAAASPAVLAHVTGPRPSTAARPAHWADRELRSS